MPRNKPTNKLDVIGNLDLKPEDAVGDYIESKAQEKYFIKPPHWDVPGDTLELFAISNEREYVEMKKLQAEMLKDAKVQKALDAKRIEEIEKIAKALKEKFIEVNTFIRDCEEKEQVAVAKIRKENAIQAELKAEIEKFKKDIRELEQFIIVLQETVNEMEPYETVIENVIKADDMMKSVKDCMDRCDAIMLAEVEITALNAEKIKSIDEIRQKMIRATNDAALLVLGLNNELAELERLYKKAKAAVFKWEKIIARTKDYIIDNVCTREQLLNGLHHVCMVLCKRRGIEIKMKKGEIEKQLDFIKHEINILTQVADMCKKEESESKKKM